MREVQILAGILVIPFVWLALYAVLLITRIRVRESVPVVAMKIMIGLLFSAYVFLCWQGEIFTLALPHWLYIPGSYDFALEFRFTPGLGGAALTMLLLLAVLVRYSESYLHKEIGFHRFFFLFSVFLGAFPLVVFADHIDVLFIGWELIGITSVLLINFYEHREHTAMQSWWAMATYRFCDVGLLAGTALAHYAVHTSNIELLNNPAALMAQHPEHQAWLGVLAGLILFASLGKAAQLPFTSWIIRAMEGPTPSSALYYGALSVGLGPILLLKFQGLLLFFPWVQAAIITIGLLTALYAFLVAKTRTDAKGLLALSAVFEVSVMVVEVGLGLYSWVLFHFAAHAFLRASQFLRSMNAIHDFYDNPLFFRGAPHHSAPWPLRLLPLPWQKKIYYLAVNGFGLDWFWLNVVIRPWMGIFQWFNKIENRLALGQSEMNSPIEEDDRE